MQHTPPTNGSSESSDQTIQHQQVDNRSTTEQEACRTLPKLDTAATHSEAETRDDEHGKDAPSIPRPAPEESKRGFWRELGGFLTEMRDDRMGRCRGILVERKGDGKKGISGPEEDRDERDRCSK